MCQPETLEELPDDFCEPSASTKGFCDPSASSEDRDGERITCPEFIAWLKACWDKMSHLKKGRRADVLGLKPNDMWGYVNDGTKQLTRGKIISILLATGQRPLTTPLPLAVSRDLQLALDRRSPDLQNAQRFTEAMQEHDNELSLFLNVRCEAMSRFIYRWPYYDENQRVCILQKAGAATDEMDMSLLHRDLPNYMFMHASYHNSFFEFEKGLALLVKPAIDVTISSHVEIHKGDVEALKSEQYEHRELLNALRDVERTDQLEKVFKIHFAEHSRRLDFYLGKTA